MIDSKFKAPIEYTYHRLLTMIRNWDVLEELSTSGRGSTNGTDMVLIEGYRFNFTTGVCSNISHIGCAAYMELEPYERYAFRDFWHEYIRCVNEDWCKLAHGHVVEDINYLISGRSEYARPFAYRRFYANPKRLHYAIYLSKRLQTLLT